MLDIEKLNKANIMSRRMYLMDFISKRMGLDIYYVFGLLNMYNAKNKGRWFWQKATFTGILKDDFEKFNKYMDRFAGQFKSYDGPKVNSSLDEAQVLLEKLIKDLEASMLINREIDGSSISGYLDDNMKNLIDQGLKGLL